MPKRRPSRLQEMIDFAEKQAIEWAYEQTGGVYKAAKLLGVSAGHLYKLVAKHNLDYMIRHPHTKKGKPKRAAKKKAARSPSSKTAGGSTQTSGSAGKAEPKTSIRSPAPAEIPADPA